MLFPERLRVAAVGATLALGVSVSTATAGLQDPGLEINWWVNGNFAGSLAPVGTYNPLQDWWNYQGFATDFASGVTLNFNLNGDPDPLISGNLTVENPFLPTVDVVLQVLLPIAPQLTNGSEMQGSAAIGLTTDSGGGSISSINNVPLWQGLIDGAPVGPSASMFFDPFVLQNAGLGSSSSSANFGLPNAIAGPDVLNNIGIEIAFALTQNDQASITSVFNVVPAPGAIALLGVAALMTRRRRRR